MAIKWNKYHTVLLISKTHSTILATVFQFNITFQFQQPFVLLSITYPHLMKYFGLNRSVFSKKIYLIKNPAFPKLLSYNFYVTIPETVFAKC